MTDLNELRAAALYAIRRFNVPENTPALPLYWRVIIGDSESMDGLAPVCPSVADTTGLHVIDRSDGSVQDDTGVYDCCPTPWIEAGHGEISAYLVALLNADAVHAQAAANAAEPEDEMTDADVMSATEMYDLDQADEHALDAAADAEAGESR
ncbi:hypothetical protein [Streptomyces sp. CA-111067]|uniref:hypothetical protein n=1 Tax=Streptomyces sp. CA-111067 TaxID=3240046 RepID=UPI003D956389